MPAPSPLPFLLALLATPAAAHAQPEPSTTVSAPASGQPDLAPADPMTIDQVAALLKKARSSYHKGVIAERVTLRESWPNGRESTSTVTFLLDNGIPELGWPRRLRLELGRLTICSDDHELTAVNTQDPTTYFVAQLPNGLSMGALRGVLPPVPLPQLEWALGDPEAPFDPARSIPGAGPITWSSQTSESRTHQFTFNGEAKGGPVQLIIDEPRGCLVRMSGPFGPKGPAGQARLDIDIMQIEGAAIPQADQWPISTTGRVAVGFLAELKGRPPEVVMGDRLPDLSLMSLDMKAVSLQEVLTPAPEGPLPNTRPSFGALVIYRAADAAPSADAQAGAKAIATARSLVSNAFADAAKRPRIAGLVVATLQLQEFTRPHLAEIDQEWAKDAAAPDRAFSPSGNDLLLRLANKASAAMVIVDSDQKVLRAVALDGRAGEDAAIAQEALEAINKSLGPP